MVFTLNSVFTRRYGAIAGVGIFLISAGVGLFFILKRPIVARPSSSLPSLLSDLVFQDMDGNTVSVSSLRGRSVVFDIWASWCILCVEHMSHLAAMQKEFGDKIMVIEINRGESSEIVKKYLEQNSASKGLLFMLDANDLLYQEIGGFFMPETIFLDKEGKIIDHTRGPMGIIEMRRRIEDSFAL